MSTTKDFLSRLGLKSIGICSTLWINSEGRFKAGLFYFHKNLHLVVELADKEFWIVPVTKKSVEICLRGETTLFKLATTEKSPSISSGMILHKAKIVHKFRLWYIIKKIRPVLIPNHYYLWNQYISVND